MRRLALRLAEQIEAERERWILWLPVAAGIGVVLYFQAPAEPAWGSGLVALAAASAVALGARRRPALAWPAAVAAALAAGFALAQLRSAMVGAPMLDRPLGPVRIEGRVADLDLLPEGPRIVLDEIALSRLAPERRPRRVRLRLRHGVPAPPVGARIRVLAELLPPRGPVAPGAYDFRRQAYFQGIGATGYAMGHPEILAAAGEAPLSLWLEEQRQHVQARVFAMLEGDRAAIAGALLTGERGPISEDANRAMRDAGLTHLLSISGVHISIIAALIFAASRAVLALIEPVALSHPIKKRVAPTPITPMILFLFAIHKGDRLR